MNNDLISREALKKKLQARHDNGEEDFDKGYNIGIETAIDLIDNAPTVPNEYMRGYEAAEREYKRPQGEWVLMYCSCGDRYYTCSICNRAIEVKNGQSLKDYPYCHCGASMKGGAE